jgi:hypothetical protein
LYCEGVALLKKGGYGVGGVKALALIAFPKAVYVIIYVWIE